MPVDPMGNVCGCVRAEKEEQYFDPAKSPLSPEKYSPGRKYFRKKPSPKVVGDAGPAGQGSEKEGKKDGTQPAGEQPAVSSREPVPEDPAARPTWENGVQPGKTVAAAHSEHQPLANAVDSCSYRGTVSSAQTRDSELQVSIPDKVISEEDNPPPCTERERHSDDDSTKQGAFQRENDSFHFQKAASLSTIVCVSEKSLKNSGFVGNLSKSYSSVQEPQSTERIHPHATHHLQFTKRRHRSLCASGPSIPTVSPGSDGHKVSGAGTHRCSACSHLTLVSEFVFLKCHLHSSLRHSSRVSISEYCDFILCVSHVS